MAQVTFIGNGASDPPFLTAFGIRFALNVPTEVTDPAVVQKLRGNSHYRVEASGAAEKPATPPPLAPVAPAQAPEAKPNTDDLMAQAAAIGLRIDRRWSAARLADEIAKAQAAMNHEA